MGDMRTARTTSKRNDESPTETRELDADREASMADEGGVSAALLEIEDPEERKARHPGVSKRRGRPWLLGGFLGLSALVAFGWLRRV